MANMSPVHDPDAPKPKPTLLPTNPCPQCGHDKFTYEVSCARCHREKKQAKP